MALRLIVGPARSGKLGLVVQEFLAAATSGRDPVLVVPNEPERVVLERELTERAGVLLGGLVTTFDGLAERILAPHGRRAVCARAARARALPAPARRPRRTARARCLRTHAGLRGGARTARRRVRRGGHRPGAARARAGGDRCAAPPAGGRRAASPRGRGRAPSAGRSIAPRASRRPDAGLRDSSRHGGPRRCSCTASRSSARRSARSSRRSRRARRRPSRCRSSRAGTRLPHRRRRSSASRHAQTSTSSSPRAATSSATR